MEEHITFKGYRIDLLNLSLLAKIIFTIQAMKVIVYMHFYGVGNILGFR